MGEDEREIDAILEGRAGKVEESGADEERGKQNNNQSNKNYQTTGELDRRLLEICNGQLRALASTVNRLSTGIIVVGITCVFVIAWTHQAQNVFMDEMRQRVAMLEASQKTQAQEVLAATKAAEEHAERASKHVWELKRALKLKFSQERSAEAAQDGEE